MVDADNENFGAGDLTDVFGPVEASGDVDPDNDNFGDDAGSPNNPSVPDNIPITLPICFTPNSLVVTKHGALRTRDLREGDLVETRDNGFQPIAWVWQRDYSHAQLSWFKSTAPVLIRQGSLGDNLPERDMLVSPGHMMLVQQDMVDHKLPEPEVLVPAKKLVNGSTIQRVLPKDGVTYLHLMFDEHQVIRADGAWSESFRPGPLSFKALDLRAKHGLAKVFPALTTDTVDRFMKPARRACYGREADQIGKGFALAG